VVKVPQSWFNAYPISNPSKQPREFEYRPGLLQMHFPGNKDGKKSEKMNHWMDLLGQQPALYRMEIEKTDYPKEIKAYWAQLSEEQPKRIPDGIAEKNITKPTIAEAEDLRPPVKSKVIDD
jgi:hypothetical protein